MYKTIVFDLGGVLVDFNPRTFLLDRFCNATIEKRVYDLTFGSEEWLEMDAGNLTRLQGSNRMLARAEETGYTYEVQCVLDDWMRSLNTKTQTVEIVRRLRNMGFRLYYLSNLAEDVYDYLKDREFFSLFEGGLTSYSVHINKPDPQIYQILMERYGIDPAEAIFVDDSLPNVIAAEKLGFSGIHFESPAKLISGLNARDIGLKEPSRW